MVPGAPWTVKGYIKRFHWGKFKGLYRCAIEDVAVYEMLRQKEYESTTAQCIQNMKSKMQAVLQQGGWSSAWLLTGLSDPLRPREFAGTKEELAASRGLRLPQQLEQVEAESQGDRGIGWRGARREEVRHSLLGEDNAGLNSFDPRSCLS